MMTPTVKVLEAMLKFVLSGEKPMTDKQARAYIRQYAKQKPALLETCERMGLL